MSEDRARLFVALALPADAVDALVDWQTRALAGLDRVRAMAPEALHVTLCFLGSRPVGEIAAILAASTAGAGSPTGLSLGTPAWLPPRRPRVLAISVSDPGGELASVQEAISDALAAGGWYTPEARPFFAHVTVGRTQRGVPARAVELAPPPPCGLDGARVTLYRSWPGRGGARYEVLGQAGGQSSGTGAPVGSPRRAYSS